MGYVYLLMSTDSDGEKELFKIGVTIKSIEFRIKSLSTGNPNKITIIHSYETERYKELEKTLHRLYSSKKTSSNNEWFFLTNDEVSSFIDICKKYDDIISFLEENNHFC